MCAPQVGSRLAFEANVATALLCLIACSVHAAVGPPDGSTAQQQALVAGDPPFKAATLSLRDLPAATHRESLFNGRDLQGWDVWLGAADWQQTYAPVKWQPIGLNRDATQVFSVVTEEGAPAIFSTGKIFGALISKRDAGNYHLHLQFKWGVHQWTPMPRNSGLLYHSRGGYGAWFGTVMESMEFQFQEHALGMLIPVGRSTPGRSIDGAYWNMHASVQVGQDKAIAYPWRRYMPGGPLRPIAFEAYTVDAHSNRERPAGQWNEVDLYAFGDRAVHVVNGVPVLEARDMKWAPHRRAAARPLTHGRIQLESEGTDVYFRDVYIERIDRLPTIIAASAAAQD